MPFVILVSGSPDWTDRDTIQEALAPTAEQATVLHLDGQLGDIAAKVADALGMQTREVAEPFSR
jgi:hypothetical protein